MTEKIQEKKRRGGRSKFTPELLEQAYDYLETYNSKYGHAIPSIQGMGMVLDIHEKTFYKWNAQENHGISVILEKCKSEQHFALMDKGLKGDLNSNIVKLALGKHGYNEKHETEVKGNLEITKIERTIVHPKNTDG